MLGLWLTIGITAFGAGFAVGGLFQYLRNPSLRRCKLDLEQCDQYRQKIEAELQEIKPKLTNLNMLRDALAGQEDELWMLRGEEAPTELRARIASGQPKIITVINLKGGVGKTTTVANLAAHFGQHGKQVLTIDLDYQGSLSGMMVTAAQQRLDQDSLPRATNFLEGREDPQALRRQVVSLRPTISGVDLVTCGIGFDRFESRAMINWLIGDESTDVRHRLGAVLTSDAFSDYDLILIDAPPRMSMGAINALACSHVVLVPTVVDALSVTAIRTLVGRLNRMRRMNTALQFLGVIGTLQGQIGGADVVDGARADVLEQIAEWSGTPYLFDNGIKYFTDIAREAGTNVAYLRHANVREAYDRLAEEMCRELRL